jgi:2-polyprenyl-3-methyl-5-hydroxy-6-metoxy-1,4-benzoquinol methylase
MSRETLTAEDYSYRLPDHWLLDHEDPLGHFPIKHEAYVHRAVQRLKELGAKTVIEVGCGDGWNCGKLVEAGFDVVGTDWSRNGIAYAQMLVPEARFFCGDLRDEAFKRQFPDKFDAALFVEVLEHIPPDDCPAALRNIAEVIKNGGGFVLTTPSVNYPNENVQHYRHFDEKTLRDLLTGAGFTILKMEGYGDVPYENQMYRKMRWVQNRYYSIHPLRRRMLEHYKKHYTLDRPFDRCAGFIVTARKP